MWSAQHNQLVCLHRRWLLLCMIGIIVHSSSGNLSTAAKCSIALRVTLPSSKPNADRRRAISEHARSERVQTNIFPLVVGTSHVSQNIHTYACWPTIIIIVDSISFHTAAVRALLDSAVFVVRPTIVRLQQLRLAHFLSFFSTHTLGCSHHARPACRLRGPSFFPVGAEPGNNEEENPTQSSAAPTK